MTTLLEIWLWLYEQFLKRQIAVCGHRREELERIIVRERAQIDTEELWLAGRLRDIRSRKMHARAARV